MVIKNIRNFMLSQSPRDYLKKFEYIRDELEEEVLEYMNTLRPDMAEKQALLIWFQAIVAAGEYVIAKGYVNDKSKELFNQLCVYAEKTNLTYRLPTKDDIDKGNEFLSSLIEDLKNYNASKP